MRIKAHPLFIVYLLLISFLSSISVSLCVAAALMIHELCHYAVCSILREDLEQLELTPLGGVMTYKRGTTPSKGIKGVYIHAAGPLGNYIAVLLSCITITRGIGNYDFMRSMLIANASMLLINLLPALPLDGGQILFCIGYYLFPVSKLVCFLSVAGIVLGFSGLALAIYGFVFRGLLNCSLLIISIHLIMSAGKQKHILIVENIYTVLNERLDHQPRIRKMAHYQVSSDEPLINLIPYMKQNLSMCMIFTEDNRSYELSEQEFCKAMLEMPYATIHQAYQCTKQYQEKNTNNLENARFTP